MLIFAPPPPRACSTPVAPSLAATCAIDSPPRPPFAPDLPPRALSRPFRTTTELSTGRGLAACQLHLDRPGLKGPPDRPLAPALHPPLHRPINRLRSAERGDGTACLVRPCSDQQARPFCHRAPSHLLHALLMPPTPPPCSPANAMNANANAPAVRASKRNANFAAAANGPRPRPSGADLEPVFEVAVNTPAGKATRPTRTCSRTTSTPPPPPPPTTRGRRICAPRRKL